MDTRDCTECGHETAAQGCCSHCGAPKLRGSVLSSMFQPARRPIVYGALAMALAIFCSAAFAQE